MPPFSISSRTKAQASKRFAKSANELLQNARLDLGPTQEKAVLERLKIMPESCRRGYLRAMGGRSQKAAIKAFCLECVGWDRKAVASCTATACPLYPYRPFRRA